MEDKKSGSGMKWAKGLMKRVSDQFKKSSSPVPEVQSVIPEKTKTPEVSKTVKPAIPSAPKENTNKATVASPKQANTDAVDKILRQYNTKPEPLKPIARAIKKLKVERPEHVTLNSGNEANILDVAYFSKLLEPFAGATGHDQSVSLWMKEFPSIVSDGQKDKVYKGIKHHDLKTNRVIVYTNEEIPIQFVKDSSGTHAIRDPEGKPRNTSIDVKLIHIGSSQQETRISPPLLDNIEKQLYELTEEKAKEFYRPGGVYTREYSELETSIPVSLKEGESVTVPGYMSVNSYHYDENDSNINRDHFSWDVEVGYVQINRKPEITSINLEKRLHGLDYTLSQKHLDDLSVAVMKKITSSKAKAPVITPTISLPADALDELVPKKYRNIYNRYEFTDRKLKVKVPNLNVEQPKSKLFEMAGTVTFKIKDLDNAKYGRNISLPVKVHFFMKPEGLTITSLHGDF